MSIASVHIFWILSRGTGIAAILVAGLAVTAGLLAGRGRLMKLGKFGGFIGCTNYPECRYTRQFTSGNGAPDGGIEDGPGRSPNGGWPFTSCHACNAARFAGGTSGVQSSSGPGTGTASAVASRSVTICCGRTGKA